MDVLRQRIQPVAQAVTAQRFLVYACVSTLAVLGVIANACRNYSNFYSVAIYLGRSGRSVVFLANFCCLLALLCGKVFQRLFFGPLQPREVERLYDQTWMFVTESLLAFTIFRDEFDIPFGVMFGFLLFIKCFHWLMSDRMESMDQIPYPGPSIWFHIRMNALFLILWIVDIVAFAVAIDNTMNSGVGGMVLFANEYAILMASSLNSMAKYVINFIEFRRARSNGGENAPPWEDKSMYMFYVELVTDFLKLVTYVIFFAIIIIYYGLPLNMIRDVYVTARSFVTRFRALSRYRTATRDMDRRYPNATDEELNAMSDRTCIICRDELLSSEARRPNENHAAPNITPKKLPCGHIFHFNCLRSWLERQQSCPTCRRSVLENNTNTRPGQQPNGRPVPPQAGAIQVNPFGIFGLGLGAAAQAQQQQMPQPQGWFGGLLNGGVQPPPGQVGHGFAPGVNAGQMGWGHVPQQPPPYGFMYPYQPQPQQLQPPPVYPGFYGPGGAWQQWVVEPQRQQQPPQPQPPQPQPPVAPATGTGTPTTQTPAVSTEAPASPSTGTPHPSPANTSFTAWTEGQRASTPRDAAVSAAMRRMNSGGVSPTSTVPNTPLPNGTPSSSSIASSSSAPQAAPEGGAQLPKLIPLTDFGALPRAGFVPGAGQGYQGYRVSTQQNGFNSTQQPPQQQQQQPHSHPSYTQQQQQNRQAQAVFRNLSVQAINHRPSSQRPPQQQQQQPQSTSFTQLPSLLSEEQLLRMSDRVTREGIDERVRVLTGVDELVNRCIDELVRMRSVLPPLEGSGEIGASGSGGDGGGESGHGLNEAASVSEKGKGKETDSEVVES